MLKAEHITKKYPAPGKKGVWLDAVSDVEKPESGSIFLNDLNILESSRKILLSVRGQVQLVMQDAVSSLDAHMSTEEIIEEPLQLLFHMNKAQRKERCAELIKMVQLGDDVLSRWPDKLSGGQQKRLCIARALAAKPQHILFDESFTGLDVTLRKQILEFLRNLQQELKLSFLIITHDLDIAMYMGGTVHVMRQGRIIETVEKPRHFSDFQQPYSKELVKAALYKRAALQ